MPDNLQQIIDSIQSTGGFEVLPPRPKAPVYPEATILGSKGIIVTQNLDGDEVSVALARRYVPATFEEEGEVAYDPFSEMAFRCFWQPDTPSNKVRINKGYLSYVYWDTDSWLHSQLEIAEETPVVSTYPSYVYLKVPVVTNVVTMSTEGPYQIFTDPVPSNIEGTDYNFSNENGTNWVGLDPVAPASYYSIETSTPSPDPGFFQLLLAEIPSEGVVKQKTFGDVKLPQPMYTNLTSLTVAPA